MATNLKISYTTSDEKQVSRKTSHTSFSFASSSFCTESIARCETAEDFENAYQLLEKKTQGCNNITVSAVGILNDEPMNSEFQGLDKFREFLEMNQFMKPVLALGYK